MPGPKRKLPNMDILFYRDEYCRRKCTAVRGAGCVQMRNEGKCPLKNLFVEALR